MKLIDEKTALTAQQTFARNEPVIDVLLVDDQPIVAEGVKSLIDGQGFRLHYCQSARKALGMAASVKPTVILLDLLMPDVHGLLLLRYFRANPATCDVPVVVLSGREDAGAKAQAFEEGAADYMIKFPQRTELCARLRYHARAYINLMENPLLRTYRS
jgi:PleD family two-component response regulator